MQLCRHLTRLRSGPLCVLHLRCWRRICTFCCQLKRALQTSLLSRYHCVVTTSPFILLLLDVVVVYFLYLVVCPTTHAVCCGCMKSSFLPTVFFFFPLNRFLSFQPFFSFSFHSPYFLSFHSTYFFLSSGTVTTLADCDQLSWAVPD